jgi:hypothetical protein
MIVTNKDAMTVLAAVKHVMSIPHPIDPIKGEEEMQLAERLLELGKRILSDIGTPNHPSPRNPRGPADGVVRHHQVLSQAVKL